MKEVDKLYRIFDTHGTVFYADSEQKLTEAVHYFEARNNSYNVEEVKDECIRP
jgi:hypothetical protein